MKFKVALARFPGQGVERMECVDWLIQTVRKIDRDPRIQELIPICLSDVPITMTRNKAVLMARARGATHLLMVDSDMVPDLKYPGARPFWDTAWEFMMARREDEQACIDMNHRDPRSAVTPLPPATIAAPYCGPPPDEMPMVFQFFNRQSGNPNPDFRLEMIPRATAAVATGIQQMEALPTGLILYDMRVFDILPPPWFRYEFRDKTESEKVTTEDVYQTRNASLLGLPQFAAFDCWAGHHKGKLVGKPTVVTRDQVHATLREAVIRGVDSRDKLTILADGSPDPAFVPPVSHPLPPNSIITSSFPDSWRDRANRAYELFADDLSRETFTEQFKLRMGTKDPAEPNLTQQQPDQYFPAGIYRHNPDEVFIDCGGFDGDTIAELLTHGRADRIISFEPDPECFEKLNDRCNDLIQEGLIERIQRYRTALADKKGPRRFRATGDGQSSFVTGTAGTTTVDVVTLDSILKDENPTYIKMDIEGAEPEALRGAARTIARCQPMLAICCYHLTDHLWEIPLLLRELCPDHVLYLRHHAASFWEVVCYAVPRERPR